VGAGIAGLEAARVLSLKGHHVDLYEKDYNIGGQINIASVPPRKEEMRRLINYYQSILPTLDVTCYFGHEFTAKDAKKYQDIIVAIGAHNLVPNIPGIKGSNVANAWDVLSGKAVPFGNVVVCGGGLVGAETAEYLASKGNKVTIIEMMEEIAKEESPTIRPVMFADFKNHGVNLLVNTKVLEITPHGVKVEHIIPAPKPQMPGRPAPVVVNPDPHTENWIEEISCDFVVNALASAKNTISLDGIEANIIYIGDQAGARPSNIDNAIKTAYDAANSIN
jgi:NADPH-dependent 2,4-dienoyl-CoA reductase/sulfur reductase-like enzyme